MKKVSGRIGLCVVVLLLAPLVIADAEAQRVEVRPMDVTVLWAGEAELHGNIKPPERGGTEGEKPYYWTEGWTSLDDYYVWELQVPEAGEYKVAITYSCLGEAGSQFEITAGDSKVTGTVNKTTGWLPGWGVDYTSFEEVPINGTLHLPKGPVTMTLRATTKPETGEVMRLYTVELTPLSAVNLIAAAKERAIKMRASTDWFVDAKYGVTFHWGARTKPRRGPPKPYCDAVRDFDVNAFAEMVEKTGAGYVFFTTYGGTFPAPIKSIEKLLPGTTCERDLIVDMSDALNKRGIKLILYNPGLRTGGFSEAYGWRKEGHQKNFCDIFTEIGERYGDKVAGFWFDFSPFNVSHHFEPLYKAAKAGNPDRIIAWNSWIQRQPSDFQEFFAGEMAGLGTVPEPNHYKDLQPHAWIIVDNDGGWSHRELDTDIGPPLETDQHLIDFVKACNAKNVVVSMNVGIYQDGTISPATAKQLRALREAIKGK